MKILKLYGLLLLVAMLMPSEGHSGVKGLTNKLPTVCRVISPPEVKRGLDLSGVVLTNKNVLTSGVMDRRPRHQSARVYVEGNEHSVAKIHMLPYGEKHRTLWSDSHPGVSWTPLFRQETHEELTILELKEPISQEVQTPVFYSGVHDEEHGFSSNWRLFVWENLLMTGAGESDLGEIKLCSLTLPYALFPKGKEEENCMRHCMLLGMPFNENADPENLFSSCHPVDIGKLSEAEQAYLRKLYQKCLADGGNVWALKPSDQGAPIYTSSGQLLGLCSEEQCFGEEGKIINGAFPIITLIDPETGRLRDDVVQLFDTAGLSITDDGILLAKE